MLFGKLLPREGNFFEMFNQHAERIVEAAQAFAHLVDNYGDAQLREKYHQEVAWDKLLPILILFGQE